MKYLLNEKRKLIFLAVNLWVRTVFFSHFDIMIRTTNPSIAAKRNGTENRSKCSTPIEYSKCKGV